MKALALLCLLLAGCSAFHARRGGELRQGVPAAPEPPAFEPSVSAPTTTGQPGYVGPVERLPRSPHQRHLPETPTTRREPGMWSGDAHARGSERDDDDDGERLPPPSLWGVPLPLGSHEDEGAVASVSHLCRGPLWQAGVMASLSNPRVRALEDWAVAQRRCGVASIYYVCSLHHSERFRQERDPAWRVRAAYVVKAAEDFLDTCSGLQIKDDEKRMVGAIIKAYLSLDRR